MIQLKYDANVYTHALRGNSILFQGPKELNITGTNKTVNFTFVI